MQALAARGAMKAVSVGDAMWIDVDTPMAHTFAERSLARYGIALAPAHSSLTRASPSRLNSRVVKLARQRARFEPS